MQSQRAHYLKKIRKFRKRTQLMIFFRFGLALNMVGALVYMHSRYTAARMVEEEKDLESTNTTV